MGGNGFGAKQLGVKNRGETTRGKTCWGRNVLLPYKVHNVYCDKKSKPRLPFADCLQATRRS